MTFPKTKRQKSQKRRPPVFSDGLSRAKGRQKPAVSDGLQTAYAAAAAVE
ncbi:hypothetical protein HMPREF9120_01287 [Neisseria sp. oral taxon 020 str. F0370]|nr:hypothetical protein HMPREF9120_01287 [Neisseria sp. oral taxon 020 str. F0370]